MLGNEIVHVPDKSSRQLANSNWQSAMAISNGKRPLGDRLVVVGAELLDRRKRLASEQNAAQGCDSDD
jgi:hypothetical protein